MKKYLVGFGLFFSVVMYGQSFDVDSLFDNNLNGNIKGVVLDNETNNSPLAFAKVTIKNTSLSTTTDLDGSFSFNLKSGNYTLIFSFIGYKTLEICNIKVSKNTTLHHKQLLSVLAIQSPIYCFAIKIVISQRC
jgi:hypothetical protein